MNDGFIGCKTCSDTSVDYIIHSFQVYDDKTTVSSSLSTSFLNNVWEMDTNGVIDSGEECDDGNLIDGDG
eukprot:CAMPEP_0205800402 /NCGR_PEP_ID=MMETSP0205-20121125/2054_1 /ASSEMBLY_ACC=CAM_ASM_000278 /TAXON_ID=36767 /ORGANISM="Euplotes focardii, Strain TN1" /LENGTH=69 /DNA_ID=CAMNT_0053063441 /DNA_START=580 /DNA_END=789 /DNA_ORIENTATION=+